MRCSHFTLRAPMCPGTTTRTGPPWACVSGSPFISQTSIVSAAVALAALIEPP
jgi:hypothetical protein